MGEKQNGGNGVIYLAELLDVPLEKRFKFAFRKLDERQRQIVRMLYGYDMTHRIVGGVFGVTAKRIRQIEFKAVALLGIDPKTVPKKWFQ